MKDVMYDKMYETEMFHWWFRAKREIVLALAAPYLSGLAQGRLVDFGCGCGAMLAALASYGQPVGLDFSERALRYCRGRFSGELKQADLSKPIREDGGQYDFGVALDILEHIDDDLTAAKNLHFLIRPGGECIVTVPAFQWLWSSHDVNCMHKRRYGKRQLKELLSAAGFQVDLISYYNCYLFAPAAAVRLLSRILPFDRGSSVENKARDSLVNRLLYRIFLSEKSVLCGGKTFPFGLSLIAVAKKPL